MRKYEADTLADPMSEEASNDAVEQPQVPV